MPSSILILDDDIDICRLFKTGFQNEGFTADIVSSLKEAKSLIEKKHYDAVLADVFLGDENGLNGLQELIKISPCTRYFSFTSQETIPLAVGAMEKGAANFFPKSLGLHKIIELVKSKLNLELESPSQDICSHPDLIGQSHEMLKVLSRIHQFSQVDSTVLIIGESGTGKEIIAKAIHEAGSRKEGNFEAINCGAIPENLLESEFFGHTRGAFTDAKTDKKGLFEICSNGTLMLDEIGDMPLSLQVKLLRVLQEKEIRPVGATRTIPVNPRIIACTHRDLSEMVQEGTFRQDLLFRLSVLRLDVPPLRQRKEDIPLLAHAFIERFKTRFKKNITPPSHELLVRLQNYDWPGNVRELQNSLERAVVLAQKNELSPEDIFDPQPPATPEPEKSTQDIPLTHEIAKSEFEKNYTRHLLEESQGNITLAAKMSGKHRVEIYRLMKKFDFHREDFFQNKKKINSGESLDGYFTSS